MEEDSAKSKRSNFMKLIKSNSIVENKFSTTNTQTLRVVVVSDYHLNTSMLQKFSEQIQSSKVHYDYCFVSGDIANCNYENNSHNQEEMLSQTTQFLSRLQDILHCKILFIPGNHDNKCFFEGKQHPNPSIINIHKKEYYLQTGLKIYGLGGSLPAHRDTQRKNKVWAGYPYQTEQQYSKDLNEVLAEKQEDISKIYMMHIGPSISNTTVARRNDSSVYAGSYSLNKVINQDNLILFLHGHVHEGSRFQRFNQKSIINPGSLLQGQYAKIQLVGQNKKWKVKSICFEKIQ